jgi:exoribonuclease R
MATSDRRTRSVERAAVDATEAWLLAGREGALFDAVVVDADGDRGTVVLAEPAIRGRCVGTALEPGSRVRVRLTEADVARRSVRFEVVA